MANNVFSYAIIVAIFLAISGSVLLVGKQAVVTNPTLESDSVGNILGYDTELYSDFQINATSGDVSALRVNKDSEGFEGAEPEEREYLQSRADLENVKVSYGDISSIPGTLVRNSQFIDYNNAKYFLGLIGSILGLGLFIVGYKFARLGKADKEG